MYKFFTTNLLLQFHGACKKNILPNTLSTTGSGGSDTISSAEAKFSPWSMRFSKYSLVNSPAAISTNLDGVMACLRRETQRLVKRFFFINDCTFVEHVNRACAS